MSTQNPTPEQVDRAMKKFMEDAARKVAKIPLEDRVFLSNGEIMQVIREREQRKPDAAH